MVRPQYTRAARQALESFPVEAEGIEFVSYSENVTFRVTARGGDTDYVLRLHRPGYNSLEELDSERMWTSALSEAGIRIPESLPTRGGRHFELIDIPGTGGQRYAGMTTWIEGSLLSENLASGIGGEERERVYREIGALAAAIHNQSTGWKEPPGFVRRRLDLEGLLGEEPHWGRFWEHEELTAAEQEQLLKARDTARARLSDYGAKPDNFGLIHADLHPENIVYDGGELALIDFDDAAYGWHLYDIASALIEGKFTADIDAAAAIVDGYREHRPLSERDLDLLPTFLLVRGMATIGWFHQRPEHAGSEYFENVKTWVLEVSERISR